MVNKHAQRSDETKKLILLAAGELFSQNGYDTVTMRQIAKEAGCSHTTIYLYFKDKETLLYQLAMPYLLGLHERLHAISLQALLTSEEKLKEMSLVYIHFCLKNLSMYSIFINTKSSRVDEEKPELEINQLRIQIFQDLQKVIKECLNVEKEEQLLTYTRIFYYNLNGILSTYSYPHESLEELMERLTSTFNLAVEILILGFKEKLKQGEEKECGLEKSLNIFGA